MVNFEFMDRKFTSLLRRLQVHALVQSTRLKSEVTLLTQSWSFCQTNVHTLLQQFNQVTADPAIPERRKQNAAYV